MNRKKLLAILSFLLAALLLAGCGMDALVPSEMDGEELPLPEEATPEPDFFSEEPHELPGGTYELPEIEVSETEQPAEEAMQIEAEQTAQPTGEAPAETEEPVKNEEPAETEAPAETALPEQTAVVKPTPIVSDSQLPDVDIESWQFMLGNSYNSVAFYYPKEVAYFEAQGMDARILEDTARLINDARAAGLTIYIAVGYRNQDFMLYQTLNGMYAMPDAREAWKHTQPMGTNEHQMGLGIDFTDDINNFCSYYPFEDGDPASSATFQWLMENCQDYGFIYRYPEEKQPWYGTPCEHWHFRYVGVEAAKYIKDNNLCLEEFLRLYDPNAAFIPEHGNIYG